MFFRQGFARVARVPRRRLFSNENELPPPPGSSNVGNEEVLENRIIPLEMYPGLSEAPFGKEIAEVLLADLPLRDVEIRPEGILFMPEIKYRRVLNRAFGPGGWGLVPITESMVKGRVLVRDYALFCLGRFVAQAKGEHESFGQTMSVGVAEESAKSQALMRCCKDLGIGSELWDPQFILNWKEKYAVAVFVEHAVTKKKSKMWRRKDRPPFGYPFTEATGYEVKKRD